MSEHSSSDREVLIEQFSYDSDHQERLNRVVVIAVDKHSVDYVLTWALTHFIRPKTDLAVLVNSREVDVPLAPYLGPHGYIDENDDGRRQESHQLLKKSIIMLREHNVACKAYAMIGDAKQEVVRKCDAIRADTLIMGSKQYGTIKRHLLGSVSDYCVHHAQCAVIIARPEPVPTSNRRKSIFNF